MIKKTLKIAYTGYHFTPGEMGEDGVYAGEWDDKLVSKIFSIPESKVNPALVPNESGKISSEAYAAAYANAKAIVYDGLFDMGELTPVLIASGSSGEYVQGLAQMFEGAVSHPTSIEIYWEVVEDQPLESA